MIEQRDDSAIRPSEEGRQEARHSKSVWAPPEVARLLGCDAEGHPGDSHPDGMVFS